MSDNQKNVPAKAAPKKPNVFASASKGLGVWWREMRSELKKVVWPTPKQVANNSLIVIIAVVLVGAAIALFDFGATQAIMAIIGAFHPV